MAATGSRPPELPADPPAGFGAAPAHAGPRTAGGQAVTGGQPADAALPSSYRLLVGDPTALADAYTRHGDRLLTAATAAGRPPMEAATVARAVLVDAWEHPLQYPAGDEAFVDALAAEATRLATERPAGDGGAARRGRPEPARRPRVRPARPVAGPAGADQADPRAALLGAALARRPAVAAAPPYAAPFAAWIAAVDRVLAELGPRDWDRPTAADGRTPREIVARLAGLDAALAGAIGIPVAGGPTHQSADTGAQGTLRAGIGLTGPTPQPAGPAAEASSAAATSAAVTSAAETSATVTSAVETSAVETSATETGPTEATDSAVALRTSTPPGTAAAAVTAAVPRAVGAASGAAPMDGSSDASSETVDAVGMRRADERAARARPARSASYWPAVFWPPVFWPPVLLWQTWHEGARGLCAWLAGRESGAARVPVDALGWTAPVEDHLVSRMLGTWLDGRALASAVGVRFPELGVAELRAATALALHRIRWRTGPGSAPADGPLMLTLTTADPAADVLDAGLATSSPAGDEVADQGVGARPGADRRSVVGQWLVGPGRSPREVADPVDAQPPVAELRLDVVAFCLLAAGRRSPMETAAGATAVRGDPAAGHAALAGAAGVLPA